jgi:hypothetical protein
MCRLVGTAGSRGTTWRIIAEPDPTNGSTEMTSERPFPVVSPFVSDGNPDAEIDLMAEVAREGIDLATHDP